MTMDTHPIIDQKKGNYPFAFEIENVYVGIRKIAQLLSTVSGVNEVSKRKLFSQSSDVHIEFKYLNTDYIVWEPYGDSSRYWIGPKNTSSNVGDISKIENVFRTYRPPFYREIIGDILSLRPFKRTTRRS